MKKKLRDAKLRKRAVGLYLLPSIVGTLLVAFLNYPTSWYVGLGMALLLGILAQKFVIKHGFAAVVLGTATALVSSNYILKSFFVLLPASDVSPSSDLTQGFSRFRPLHLTGLKIPEHGVRSATEAITYFSLFNIVYGRQPGESLTSYTNRRFETQQRFERTLQFVELRAGGETDLYFRGTGLFAACVCDDSWSEFRDQDFYLVQNPESLIAFEALAGEDPQLAPNAIVGEPYSSLLWARLQAILLGFGLPVSVAMAFYRHGVFSPPER